MASYLYEDIPIDPNLDHPDSAIRLASCVHRFKVPKISDRSLSFVKSFETVGKHGKTKKCLLQADESRVRLKEACESAKISAERVTNEAQRYIPLIHNILTSCKVQPEMARLDQKLLFEWMSGIEAKPTVTESSKKKKKSPVIQGPSWFVSEAIMYDLTMAIACEALGRAAAATENSMAGEFAAASRDYAAAAGIMEFLYKDHLPKWVSKGSNVQPSQLPSECHVAATQALQQLFMANGQQMAVTTVLMKPGKPNYSLLAKLCLGIADQLEEFMSILRKSANEAKLRMDSDFFTLMAFQIAIQKSLSLYFQGRAAWDKDDHGVAIALMSEATVAIKTRESAGAKGVPDISTTASMNPLKKDLNDLRQHMGQVLHTWEKDNSAVYFAAVPQHLSAEKKLQKGLQMNKSTPYKLQDAEPLLLVLPEGALQRSDSDLARELQEKLNAGEDVGEFM